MLIGSGASSYFHGKRDPRELDAKHLESFLTHLAVERGAPSTQSQAKTHVGRIERGALESLNDSRFHSARTVRDPPFRAVHSE
jgi:hypothetical protein